MQSCVFTCMCAWEKEKKKEIHCFVLQKTKFKVKFEKGTRGLLSSNHISLESNPNPAVLNVGSRVVGRFKAFVCVYSRAVCTCTFKQGISQLDTYTYKVSFELQWRIPSAGENYERDRARRGMKLQPMLWPMWLVFWCLTYRYTVS